MREGKDPAALDQPEIDLKVSHQLQGMHLAYPPELCLACEDIQDKYSQKHCDRFCAETVYILGLFSRLAAWCQKSMA